MDQLLIEMGLRIANLRREKDMTQEELAELVGVATQTVSTAELGKKALRPENIVKISRVLGVSTDFLLTGRKNRDDCEEIGAKLRCASPEKYDQVMRVIDIMLEEN